MPADLLALLHRPSTVSRLAAAGIETTRELLRLDEAERKFTPKTGPALWRTVEDLLAEHQPGVKLGCLAEGAPSKPAGRDQGQGWIEETSQTLEWARKRREERLQNAG